MSERLRVACERIRAYALERHAAGVPWFVFLEEVLGVRGYAWRECLDAETLGGFWASSTYREVLELVADLRAGTRVRDRPRERVIYVRVPTALYESLAEEARESRVSVNCLAVTKLLRRADGSQLPVADALPRGRRCQVFSRGA